MRNFAYSLGVRRFLIPLVLLAIVVTGVLTARVWSRRSAPGAPTVTVIVPEGSTLPKAARRLAAARLISEPELFARLAGLLGPKRPIRAGEYAIPRGAGWAQILEQLQSGRVVQHLVTIPEGLPAVLVAERLAAAPYLIGPVPTPPEGAVLPQTYAYQRGETHAQVLARMTGAMHHTLSELWPARSKDAAVHSPQEALTLASIVEKETALANERPLVAGVYSNRLRLGMKLDADPTVIYPITKGRPLGRPIRQSDLHADTGYNTYLKPGLPAGPIANPSRSSLFAVLHPAETKALYFVANGQGGHVFAATIEEQSRNVARWKALRARPVSPPPPSSEHAASSGKPG